MAAFLDACRFNPTAGGTTDWTVSSVVLGYLSPAAAGAVTGRTYKYRAESADLTQWEIGEGVYSLGTNTIARTTVLFNSAGTTAKINFTAAPQVAVVALKEDLISVEEANAFTAAQKAQARANIDVLKKNYIINGAMQVSQQNGTVAGTTTAYYPVDQFFTSFSNGGAISAAQVASATPGSSPNRLRVTVTTADAAVAAADYLYVGQVLEALRTADLRFGSAAAKTVTLQFGVKAPAGTYCIVLMNGAGNRSYVAEYTIAAGEANTDVVKSVTIAGDTAGTWATDNTVGIYVRWGLMVGSTYQQAAGAWGTVNVIGSANQFNFMGTISNVFELFDVSLTEGSAAPTFQVPDFASELALCMRYWEKSYDYANAVGSTGGGINGTENFFCDGLSAATHQAGYSMRFKVRKRATSTVTVYSYNTGASGKITDASAGADITANVDSISEVGARVYSTSTVASASVARYYQWTADARQ